MLLLVNNFQGKNITESQNRRNFESVRVICNLNSCHNFAQLCTTLHSCYMRMHSFSANQKRVIFSCTLLRNKRYLVKIHTCTCQLASVWIATRQMKYLVQLSDYVYHCLWCKSDKPPIFSFINIWCIPFLLVFLLDFSYFENWGFDGGIWTILFSGPSCASCWGHHVLPKWISPSKNSSPQQDCGQKTEASCGIF